MTKEGKKEKEEKKEETPPPAPAPDVAKAVQTVKKRRGKLLRELEEEKRD